MSLRASRAEISLPHFAANLSYLRLRLKQGTKLCLAVKGNAYGHGLSHMSLHAEPLVDAFAVATVGEGAALRHAGIRKTILLLLPHLRSEIPQIFELGLEPFVSHAAHLAAYCSEAAKRGGGALRLHLEVDTGMGRGGVLYSGAVALAKQILACDGVELYGLCTHFASADAFDETSITDTKQQLERFAAILQQLKQDAIRIPCVHAANSAALLHYPQAHFSMLRVGIAAYGYAPQNPNHPDITEIQPVMSLKSKITLIKRVPCGYKVSYGGTWVARRETLLALLPIGYADGYSRLLSNVGQALLFPEREAIFCPVVGRVSMDQIMLDISNAMEQHPELQFLEQDVELFGRRLGFDARDIARQVGSIPYEVLTSISERIPRVYLN